MIPHARLRLSVVGVIALAGLASLSACGGMTRTIGVLPNTLDDLEAKSEAARNGDGLPPGCERAPCLASRTQ